MTHTRGQWEINGPDLVQVPNKLAITITCGDPTEEQASTRLVAAAPDLLKALKSILGTVSPGGFDDKKRLDESELLRIRALSRSAIAKAEGQQ